MPILSDRSSMQVVRGRRHASDAGLLKREHGGDNRDNKAEDADEARQGFQASPVSDDRRPDGPGTMVAQHGPEASPISIAAERPRRQKRRSLKLTLPSLQLGRRRNLSLPPITANVTTLDAERTGTSPITGNVSSSPTSPKRFWHVLRSSSKQSGFEDYIQPLIPSVIPKDNHSILDNDDNVEVHTIHCGSSVNDWHSIVSDSTEQVDSQFASTMLGEFQRMEPTSHTPLELATILPRIVGNFEEQESSGTTKRVDLPPIDPAYKAILPIVYGLEEITTNPRRRSVGEEHKDEDYSKFWETLGQLSAKEVLYAVYAIREGALDMPVRDSPTVHTDVPLLTALCATWAGLAIILAVYFYFCSQ